MNKSERKYLNTAARMDEAFLALLEKKDFAGITVKEICERARVNRSTFYLHYETIADLLSESAEYLYDQFMKTIKPNADDFVMKLRDCPAEELYLVTPEYLTPYLGYIKEHKRLFSTVVENAGVLRMEDIYGKLFRQVFTPILERYRVPAEDRRYIMAFYIQGLMAIVAEWLKDGCADPVDRVIAVIQQCVARHREVRETQGIPEAT